MRVKGTFGQSAGPLSTGSLLGGLCPRPLPGLPSRPWTPGHCPPLGLGLPDALLLRALLLVFPSPASASNSPIENQTRLCPLELHPRPTPCPVSQAVPRNEAEACVYPWQDTWGPLPAPLVEGRCPQERVSGRNRMWVAGGGGAGAWKSHCFLPALICSCHHPAPS